ncbi:hypothetical protein KEM56_006307, partial [Ascosphaera pollenicola]
MSPVESGFPYTPESNGPSTPQINVEQQHQQQQMQQMQQQQHDLFYSKNNEALAAISYRNRSSQQQFAAPTTWGSTPAMSADAAKSTASSFVTLPPPEPQAQAQAQQPPLYSINPSARP